MYHIIWTGNIYVIIMYPIAIIYCNIFPINVWYFVWLIWTGNILKYIPMQ